MNHDEFREAWGLPPDEARAELDRTAVQRLFAGGTFRPEDRCVSEVSGESTYGIGRMSTRTSSRQRIARLQEAAKRSPHYDTVSPEHIRDLEEGAAQ